MKWLYLTNDETNGTTEVPDQPGVRDWYQARGWKVSEKPDAVPFVPAPVNPDPQIEWVTMYHPAIDATHLYPNNTEAIAGAQESGWVFTTGESDSARAGGEPADQTPEPDPAPKTSKRRPATATADSEKENG